MYLADPVDVFFMQVQGSGRIRLPDGQMVRVHYDGKNGYPYTSIGRHLIDTGVLTADQMSLDALAKWLRADPERGRKVMWNNASYVFFRELTGAEAGGPLGVIEIPLTDGRSLAVDAGVHAIGTPIFVTSPTLSHATKGGAFERLMIAQDVGSAIKGPERGDIYFGSGDEAGRLAGVTKHQGNFYVLLPRADAAKP
jgi:membrane-bound lytic murein transglycosylase A